MGTDGGGEGRGRKGGRGQGGVGQERVEEGTGEEEGQSPQPLGGPHSQLPTPRSGSLHSPTDQKGFKKPGGLRVPHTGRSCGRLPLPPRLSRGPRAHTAPGVAVFGSCSH